LKSLAVVFLIVILWLSESIAAEPLRLTMRADSEAGKLGEFILKEAYKRAEIKMTVERLPGVRSIVEANNGTSDGEVVRLQRVLSRYKNLRMVPEYIVQADASIASKIQNIKVTGWETVKKYSAATVRGYRSIERRLKDQEHVLASNVKSALKLVELDRVKILVLSRFDILRGLKGTGYKDIKIIEPPISSVRLFHMVNKKHQSLVPKILTVLKAMKADGSHQRIVDRFLAGYRE